MSKTYNDINAFFSANTALSEHERAHRDSSIDRDTALAKRMHLRWPPRNQEQGDQCLSGADGHGTTGLVAAPATSANLTKPVAYAHIAECEEM